MAHGIQGQAKQLVIPAGFANANRLDQITVGRQYAQNTIVIQIGTNVGCKPDPP